MATCPDCRGATETLAFVDFADGSGDLRAVRCTTCRGSGEVDPELERWHWWAEKVRHARQKRRLHLGHARDATDIDLARYSAIERGAAIPTEGEVERIEAFTGVNR